MQRLLPLGTAFVLVLTACGAGHASAPRVTNTGLYVRHPSVKAVAAARERGAGRKAEKLLARVVLPRGAQPTRAPAGLRRGNLGVSILTELAYRHRFWRMREPLPEVVAFIKRHALPGFELGASASPPVSLQFDLPPVRGHPMQRLLDFELVSARGWTFLRVDAGAAWVYPRSPHEVVPAGVREIDIRGAGVNRTVADAAELKTIVRWFDALNVTQPGPAVGCPAELSSPVRFSFRATSGAELASAIVPSEPADGCNPIQFTIGGRTQRPLIDARFGRYAFVNRVQRLLGVCFRDPRRACR